MSERTSLAIAYRMGFDDGVMLLRPDASKVDGLEHKARRVVVSNRSTDHATGRCECGGCHGSIDPWDAYCRHCGALLGDA